MSYNLRTEYNLYFHNTLYPGYEVLTQPLKEEPKEVWVDPQQSLDTMRKKVFNLEGEMGVLYKKIDELQTECDFYKRISTAARDESSLSRICQLIFEGMKIPQQLEVKLITDPKDFAWRLEKEFSRIKRQSVGDDLGKLKSSCKVVEYAIAESETCEPCSDVLGLVTETGCFHKKNEDKFYCFELTTMASSGLPEKAVCFALFDGHGGDEASQFCCKQIEGALLRCLQHLNQTGSDYEIGNAMKMAFVWLDTAFRREVELKNVPTNQPGCTACVALVMGDGRLFTANAGDSRALFHMPNSCKTIPLSFDFKASDFDAKKSVIKRGGVIKVNDRLRDNLPRVQGSLAVTRAIGDEYLRMGSGVKVVTPRPKVTVIDFSSLNSEEKIGYLLLCSDGLTDVINNSSIGYVLTVFHQKWGDLNPKGMAHCLVRGAKKGGTRDDVTVGVIPLSLHPSQSV